MLQQTRVAAVIDHYHRFLAAFPSVKTLAAAPVEDVLAQWSGLGYYRRARLLHKAAAAVVTEHGGEIPRGEEAILSLPGIGRYTAGAIRSIAFGERAPILDGNVFRVTARFFVIEGSWTSEGDKKRFWQIAEELVQGANPGDFNQALMEWGALVCTPKSPGCAGCPVRRKCGALAAGRVDELPTPRVKPPTVSVEQSVYVAFDGAGKVLLRRRPPGGLMEGMWELPEEEPSASADWSKVGRFRHAILDRRYEVNVFSADVTAGSAPDGEASRWVARERLGEYALTGMASKGIRLVERKRAK